MRWGAAALLLLAACAREPAAAGNGSAGDRIEAAAVEAGLVADPARRSLVGTWGRDTDRACVVPEGGGSEGDAMRIGVAIDYGPGQGCTARGTVRRRGERLDVSFGDCRFAGRFDGARIVFPAEVPAACERLCTGRASLAALSVEAIGASAAEARTLRDRDGRPLCGS